MKSIKAKIVYYNIIKPTYDLTELFSINPGKSVYVSIDHSVQNFANISVKSSIYYSVEKPVYKSVRYFRISVYDSVSIHKSIQDNIK